MTKPITPGETKKLGKKEIPDFVLDLVNEYLISKDAGQGTTTLLVKDLVAAIMKTGCVSSKDEIFKEKMLDFENIYRKAGWEVYYDQPAYCESFEAYWRFSPKK